MRQCSCQTECVSLGCKGSVMHLFIQERKYCGVSMTPIMLPNETMFGTGVNHHVEGLIKILKSSKYFSAMKEQHIVVCHAMHD